MIEIPDNQIIMIPAFNIQKVSKTDSRMRIT